MAPRRAPTRGGISTPAARHRARGGIRKNTCSRQAPTHYGQRLEAPSHTTETEGTNEPTSSSEETEPSIPQYRHSPPLANPGLPHPGSPVTPSQAASGSISPAPSDTPISLHTMQALLHSHKQDIVDRVVLRLSSQRPSLPHQTTQPPQHNPIHAKIPEGEGQLALLRDAGERELRAQREPEAHGIFNPSQLPILPASESPSGIADSVEVLFPGVERATLVQIIENQFKPTNIYRLLATSAKTDLASDPPALRPNASAGYSASRASRAS